MLHPDSTQFQTERAALIAALRAFLNNDAGVIETARQVVGRRFGLVGNNLDEEWRTFVAIDSETDQFPLGHVRAHWAADALKAKDAEAASVGAFYREGAIQSARVLLDRYSNVD